VFEDLNNICVE